MPVPQQVYGEMSELQGGQKHLHVMNMCLKSASGNSQGIGFGKYNLVMLRTSVCTWHLAAAVHCQLQLRVHMDEATSKSDHEPAMNHKLTMRQAVDAKDGDLSSFCSLPEPCRAQKHLAVTWQKTPACCHLCEAARHALYCLIHTRLPMVLPCACR